MSRRPTASRRAAIREAYDYRCGYCGVHEHDVGGELEIDHFQPRAAGGSEELDNLVYSCPTCNRLKGSHWPVNPAGDSPRRLLHPLRDDTSEHLDLGPDGIVVALTERGRFHIDRLQLNRPALLARRRALARIAQLEQALDTSRRALMERERQLARLERELRRVLAQIDRLLRG